MAGVAWTPTPVTAGAQTLAHGLVGTTWQVVGGIPNAQFRITAIRVDPADPKFVIATVDGGGFYLSTNGGLSWAVRASPAGGLTNGEIWHEGHQRQLFVSGDRGLARSTDDGRSWTTLSQDIGEVRVVDSVILFHISGELWRSRLPIISWQHFPISGSTGKGVAYEWSHDGHETILADGTTIKGSRAVLYRKDGSQPFQPTSFPFDKALQIEAMVAVPNTTTVFVAAVGVWRSTDAGITWQSVSPVGTRDGVFTRSNDPNSICCPLITNLYLADVDGQEVLFGAGHPGMVYSTDRGMNWAPMAGADAYPRLPPFDHAALAPLPDGLHFITDIRSALVSDVIPHVNLRLVDTPAAGDLEAPGPDLTWVLTGAGAVALVFVLVLFVRAQPRRKRRSVTSAHHPRN
jgi:hypothetical protein